MAIRPRQCLAADCDESACAPQAARARAPAQYFISVLYMERHRGVAVADAERGVDEARPRDDGADAIRQRVALDGIADEIGVEPAVGVLIVIGADRVAA